MIVWDDVLVKRKVMVYKVYVASECHSVYASVMSTSTMAEVSISDYKDHKERKG